MFITVVLMLEANIGFKKLRFQMEIESWSSDQYSRATEVITFISSIFRGLSPACKTAFEQVLPNHTHSVNFRPHVSSECTICAQLPIWCLTVILIKLWFSETELTSLPQPTGFPDCPNKSFPNPASFVLALAIKVQKASKQFLVCRI